MSITILKKELEQAKWSAIFKKLNAEQIAGMLKQSNVPPNHFDEMARDISKKIEKAVIFTDDNKIHFL